MKAKSPAESFTILTNLVLPSETNQLNSLFGGELLARMDRVGSIAARRHSQKIVVTTAVSQVVFNMPIPLGSVVSVEATVTRAFKTSMEVFIEAWMEDTYLGTKTKTNEAFYTFVAVDSKGKPVEIPPIVPETETEKKRFDDADKRRQLSLLLAGKITLQEAISIQNLFAKK